MTAVPTRRVPLATWPTPLDTAPRLATAIGLHASDLWIKRDDLTGLAAGGNKIRKLEWTVAAALDTGADTLVTTGAPQSNHARLTAAAAARLGLACVLVFPGAPPAGDPTGNLVLDALLGARIEWVGDLPSGEAGARALAAAADAVAEQVRAEGGEPVVLPFGGSNAIGAHGYRLAAGEITQQHTGVQHVVCAIGSGGTMAGLVAGLGPSRVLGVHAGAVADPRAQVCSLLRAMGDTAGDDAGALRLRLDQVGDGYDSLTPAAGQAVVLAARTEGLVLDPVYSGRALAGLIAEVRDGTVSPGETVVLLASGGLPGLFGHPAAATLGRGTTITPG